MQHADKLAWRRRRLLLELLEDRLPLDGDDGVLVGSDAYLTLSFAPDNTDIAGHANTLFSKFDEVANTSVWQEAIRRAFQAWAVHTNADVGLVTDGGQPFGTSGSPRRDSRFGDVRIGAAPLSPDIYAMSVPVSTELTGTWVGDIIFNSDALFEDVDDIFHVALHESGNVFGLSDNTDPLSPLFSPGIPQASSPTPGDIADLQERFGQRADDTNETEDDDDGATRNDTLATATELKLVELDDLSEGSAPSIVYGDIANTSDADFFQIRVPSDYVGPATFTVRTEGISLLTPFVTIYDSDSQLLIQGNSTSTTGDTLVVGVDDVGSSTEFYIEIGTNRRDEFGTGGYSLVATFDADLQVEQAAIDNVADGRFRFLEQEQIADFFEDDDFDDDPLFGNDAHRNDDPASATALETSPGFVEFTRYEAIASIADGTDVDFYQVQSPDVPDGDPNVMAVSVRSIDIGGLVPAVTVLDNQGNAVPFVTLVNGGGDLLIQSTDMADESQYLIRIEAADGDGIFAAGNYELDVVFGNQATELESFATGSLTAGEPYQTQAFFVATTQLFHLALDVGPVPPGTPETAVVAIIVDGEHQEVHRVAAAPGETRSAKSVLLGPGTYGVQIVAVTQHGSPIPDLTYTFLGLAVSDPLAIDPLDTTEDGSFDCPDIPDSYCYPGPFVSDNPYLWSLFLSDLEDDPDINNFLVDVQQSAADTSNTDPGLLIAQLLGDWWFWVWQREGQNGPPLAFNDAYDVPQGETLQVASEFGVLTNDIDPELDPLVAVLADDVPTGLGDLNLHHDGSLTYVPPGPDFTGVITFSYTAYDFNLQSNSNTVTISVRSNAGAYVADRHLFYNHSTFDGHDPSGTAADDDAIASDKVPLIPGSTASLVNYSSYVQGVNGVIVDIAGLSDPESLSTADFTYRAGNDDAPDTWNLAIPPSEIAVRPGEGTGGSDRVTLIWPDGAIRGKWLQITVGATPSTGMLREDVFYFGNAVGESGNSSANAAVSSADVQDVLTHQRGPFQTVDITNRFDFNRDRLVNATDVIIARDYEMSPFDALHLLTLAPAAAAMAAAAVVPSDGIDTRVVVAETAEGVTEGTSYTSTSVAGWTVSPMPGIPRNDGNGQDAFTDSRVRPDILRKIADVRIGFLKHRIHGETNARADSYNDRLPVASAEKHVEHPAGWRVASVVDQLFEAWGRSRNMGARHFTMAAEINAGDDWRPEE